MRDTAPLSLTLAIKPLGRRQLDWESVAATRSGNGLTIHYTCEWGAGAERMAKKGWDA